MTVLLWIATALLAAMAAVLTVVVVSVHRRHRPVFLLARDAAPVADEIISLAGLTHGEVRGGNRVRIVENGNEYLAACLELIGNAKHSIHFETFLWKSGAMSFRLVSAMVERAREGLQVRVIVDGMGGDMDEIERRTLREVGAEVCVLRPVGWRHLGWLNNRTHRKILVVDGERAIVGGHCVDDRWLGDANDEREFRDISAVVEGPAVRPIQSAFCENWIEAARTVPYGPGIFPELGPKGDSVCHVAYVGPAGGVPANKLLLHLVIRRARKRLWIQTPYFVPDDQAREALIEAVARGVDVRILTPNMRVSDNWLVQHAGQYRLAPLLERGLRVYHYQRTLLHQKVWTVDEEYALIGSTNFDERSFDLDDQITLAVADRDIVKQIDQGFLADLADAELLAARHWRDRPGYLKLGEGLAYLLREHL